MKRSWLLWGGLLVSLACTWWAASIEDEGGNASDTASDTGTPTSARSGARHIAASQDPRRALAQLEAASAARAAFAPLRRNPFAARSFAPAPPALKPAPPPQPVAPPLRFSYQGLLDEGDQHYAVFLTDGDALLIARTGQTLTPEYRVVAITEQNMTLEYLPLKAQQTLDFGRR